MSGGISFSVPSARDSLPGVDPPARGCRVSFVSLTGAAGHPFEVFRNQIVKAVADGEQGFGLGRVVDGASADVGGDLAQPVVQGSFMVHAGSMARLAAAVIGRGGVRVR